MRQQICIIGGGDTFAYHEDYLAYLKTKQLQYDRLLYAPNWKNWLAEQLPDHDVLLPSMPNKQNAQYPEWAIYFSKIVPLLDPTAIIVGHSLGGIFLAKYLSEQPPIGPYAKLILIAAPHSDESYGNLSGFKLKSAASLTKAATEIHILHSEDDPVVSISECDRYAADLPGAVVHKYSDKHHFIDATFPELLELVSSAA